MSRRGIVGAAFPGGAPSRVRSAAGGGAAVPAARPDADGAKAYVSKAYVSKPNVSRAADEFVAGAGGDRTPSEDRGGRRVGRFQPAGSEGRRSLPARPGPAGRLWRGIALALAALALSALPPLLAGGCAHVAMPEEDLAERLGHGTGQIRRWRADPAWWMAYGDERLDALVELALERSPDVASAVIASSRAAVQAGLAEVDRWPSLSAGGSASVRKNLGEGAPSSRSFGTNLGLGWEIDLWRRAAAAADAAGLESLASAGDLEAARQSLANKVADAFFNLAYLHDALAESERSLGSLLAVEEIVALKHSGGQASAVEPVQAAQSVIQAKDSVINARHQLESGRTALRALMNLPPGADPPLGELSLADVSIPRPNLDVPLSVLANRPDLMSAELRLRKAFLNASSASMAWFPTISVSSAISAGGGALAEALADPVGSLGLSVALPFLDWSTISKNVRLSELEFESAKLSFETALASALNEVDLARRHQAALEGLLENARARHRLAERVSEYYRERYQAGAAELSDWISAVDSANSARLSVLSATWQLLSAGNLVFKAMSGRFVDSAPPGGGGTDGGPAAPQAPAGAGAGGVGAGAEEAGEGRTPDAGAQAGGAGDEGFQGEAETTEGAAGTAIPEVQAGRDPADWLDQGPGRVPNRIGGGAK